MLTRDPSEASLRTNLGSEPFRLDPAQYSHHTQAQSPHQHQAQFTRSGHAQTSGQGPTPRAGTDDKTHAFRWEERSPQLSRYLADDQCHERIAIGLFRGGQDKKEVDVQGSSLEHHVFRSQDRGR